jgi:hypothetical protein
MRFIKLTAVAGSAAAMCAIASTVCPAQQQPISAQAAAQ